MCTFSPPVLFDDPATNFSALCWLLGSLLQFWFIHKQVQPIPIRTFKSRFVRCKRKMSETREAQDANKEVAAVPLGSY